MDAEDDEEDENSEEGKKTPLVERHDRLRKQIERLEEDAVGAKPWLMKGEVRIRIGVSR